MISFIELKNVRKFKYLKLNINSNIVILVGSNAIGKTTILESIFLTSTTKSNRTNDIKNIIKIDNKFCKISINNNKKYDLIISETGKKMFINNTEFKKMSDYIGSYISILFNPNDLDLIYDSKQIRRNFLDLNISLINKNYLFLIRDYKKILKERNEILKDYNKEKEVIFNIINEQYIDLNKKIMDIRINFINDLNKYFKINYKFINQIEKVDLVYDPSINLKDIKQFLSDKFNYDKNYKISNYGIHRDDFTFLLNDNNALKYASQGQNRSIILALKMALYDYIKEFYNKMPILLLDDVFSEFDIVRQNNIVKYLENKYQTFITTTNIELINKSLLKKAQIIYLDKEKSNE